MSVTYRINRTVSPDEGTRQSDSYSEVGTAQNSIGPIQYPAASSNVLLPLTIVVANIQFVSLLADKGATIKTNGTNVADVQTITITGTPTGGTFPLGFGGQVTVLPYNATSGNVQTALQALSSIGSGNVTCTGGPLPGTPVVCTFAGTKTPGYQDIIKTSSVGLTGGTIPAVAITHTTPGKPTDTITLPAGIAYEWGKSAGFNACLFTQDITAAYVSCTPSTRLVGKILT